MTIRRAYDRQGVRGKTKDWPTGGGDDVAR